MAKLISKTYGDALFELAAETGKTDDFLEEVTVLWQVMDENPEFGRLMNHPKVSKEEKLRVLEDVFRGRISGEILGFMALLLRKDRYKELGQIFSYFTERVKEEKGIGTAYVTTATVLSQEQKKRIEGRLLETTSYREMEMYYEVDESLIGGMIVRIKDRVVDSSVKTKLEKLTRQLYKIQLQSK